MWKFRSKWEREFAALLDYVGLAWEYEPTTFRRLGKSYTPDFAVTIASGEPVYVELHRLENDDPRDGGKKRLMLPTWAREVRRASGCELLVLGEAAMEVVLRLRKALAPDAESRFKERPEVF